MNEEFLNHFVSVMEQQRPPEIEAYGLGGSFGEQQRADRYSDIDFFLLVTDAEAEKFMRSFQEFATLFGRPLLYRGPIFIPNYGYSFSVLYDPFICCQFNVNSRCSLTAGPIRKYTRVLFDETGYYSDFTTTQLNQSFDLTEIFQASCSLFWFRVINVWRDLSRGQYWYAIQHMYDIRRQLFILLRLKLNKHPAEFDRLVEKNLEEDLGEDVCVSLAAALPQYDRESISKALIFSAQKHKEEGPLLAESFGVGYPQSAADLISEFIRDLS